MLLNGLRVVDLTDIRGALAGRYLADLGADVLRVECAETDRHDNDVDASVFRNAGKSVERIDLDADRAWLVKKLASADVLIENFGPVRGPALGFDPADLASAHDQLVHIAVSDLGNSGPRSTWHLEPLCAQAASGALHVSGFPDLPPCSGPGFIAHDCASVFAAIGTVAAVMDRRRTSQGQLVEVGVQEAALSGLIPWSVAAEDYIEFTPNAPVEGRRNAEGGYVVFDAADGHVRTVIGSVGQWEGLVKLCRDPEALQGDEWLDRTFRQSNVDVLKIVGSDALQDRKRQELFEEALDLGTTVGVIHRPSEYRSHPQTVARGAFSDVEAAPIALAPLTIDGARPPVRVKPPATGWEGSSPWEDSSPQPDVAKRGLLLSGVRVVEFGVAAVMPEMNYILSEFGADVIKIETATRPDVLRRSGGEKLNCGYTFNVECRGRRSITLDLTTERGRELAFMLCASADVVSENQRGGALRRRGLDAESIRAANPSVIYVSSQGYGRGGPMGEMPAFGPLNSGFAGVHYLWNHPGAPYPCGTSMNHPDHIAGKMLSVAVLAAIERRRRTGEGADLELSQSEAAAYLMGEVFVREARTGELVEPTGNNSESCAPHNVYRAAGDDEWVAIVCADDAQFDRLAVCIDLSVEPEWRALPGRLAARSDIDAAISTWTTQRTPGDAAAQLQASGVSAMPVMGPQAHRSDPHLGARSFLEHLVHPEAGPETHVGNPLRPSSTVLRTAQSAPCLGEHTAEVLMEVLGLSQIEVDDLATSGVCR